MVRHTLSIALTLLASSLSPMVFATAFTQFMEADGWRADTSVFACQLTHTVPFYGEAVFVTRAGENSNFYLSPDSSRFKTGRAALIARAPVWLEQAKVVNLGEVTVNQGSRPVSLEAGPTERMLVELYNGRELAFTREPWYGDETATEVAITTVGFRAVYKRYLECLAGLLPANFDQIRRTSVYFGSNQYENFHRSELQKLDNIVAYIKADPSIKEFYIDGHTDSVGTREDNMALAQNRAEEVKRYLVEKGIPESAITSRWHGERYPIARNDTVANRAKNRRVTIRLERVKAPPSPKSTAEGAKPVQDSAAKKSSDSKGDVENKNDKQA
jgi:sodium-type flagellar protein MotY